MRPQVQVKETNPNTLTVSLSEGWVDGYTTKIEELLTGSDRCEWGKRLISLNNVGTTTNIGQWQRDSKFNQGQKDRQMRTIQQG